MHEIALIDLILLALVFSSLSACLSVLQNKHLPTNTAA